MSDINSIDLRRLDGTLLMVFLGLMRHRKATRVATEMGLTQPAVSHALKRLRELYDDPLFVRRAHGLEPTARAHALEPGIRRAARLLSASVASPAAFDPVKSEASVRIAAFDYELATLLPALISHVAGIGSRIGLHSQTLSSEGALAALTDGRVDLAIGFFETLPARPERRSFRAETLYVETYVLAAHADHPIFEDLTPATYADAPHLLVAPEGVARGVVDMALGGFGLRRTVRATVPQFFPALSILAESGLVATLPRRVAQTCCARFGLRHVPLPFTSPTFAVRAVRHRRDAENPVHAWLSDTLREQVKEDVHQTR